MIKNFDALLERAVEKGPKRISVACAQDDDVLKAIKTA